MGHSAVDIPSILIGAHQVRGAGSLQGDRDINPRGAVRREQIRKHRHQRQRADETEPNEHAFVPPGARAQQLQARARPSNPDLRGDLSHIERNCRILDFRLAVRNWC